MRTSSRSSSEAASSLRLVKMSVTPRAMVVEERERPKRRRWNQLCFGAGDGATVRGAGASAGGSTASSVSLSGGEGGASTGAVAASAPRNQQLSRPDFPLFSSSTDATNPP